MVAPFLLIGQYITGFFFMFFIMFPVLSYIEKIIYGLYVDNEIDIPARGFTYDLDLENDNIDIYYG